MNFEEHAAKPLLAAAGITTPQGQHVRTPEEAAEAARTLGPVIVKAQVPTGKRGKAGGIKKAASPDEARSVAGEILGMTIAGHTVESLLVEQLTPIARELYAAVLNDPTSKSPIVLFSTEGGMDIEEVAATTPDKLHRQVVDIRRGFDQETAIAMLEGVDVDELAPVIAETLCKLYQVYCDNDAELLEINPLVITKPGELVALDCKFVMDDSGIKRHTELAELGTPDKPVGLEARAKELCLPYIELDGNVGVLANGAGLTMTTMDVVQHHGGQPANFLEIGGEAYTKAKPALELVLANPRVKSLVINFCGAFARTDVMTEGVVNAWKELNPDIPVFFSIHGTGSQEAIALLKQELNMDPYDTMDAASKAAVEAAQ